MLLLILSCKSVHKPSEDITRYSNTIKNTFLGTVFSIITNTKKYLQFDWLRGVQYWPYLQSVFNLYSLTKQEKKLLYSNSVAEK